MPPGPRSRHRFSVGRLDDQDRRFLEGRDPVVWSDEEDNLVWLTRNGDTLWTVAHRVFHGLVERPGLLYWLIGDFQPVPIHDPTVPLKDGTRLSIPSRRFVVEEVFSERRRLG